MAKRGVKPRLKSIISLDQDWTPPAHLSELARAEFEHVADLLRQRGTLEQTDSRLVLRRTSCARWPIRLTGNFRPMGS